MRDEFIRFRNYKNRAVLRFRVRCVWALTAIERYVRPSGIENITEEYGNEDMQVTDEYEIKWQLKPTATV